jgi:hypothetical protein
MHRHIEMSNPWVASEAAPSFSCSPTRDAMNGSAPFLPPDQVEGLLSTINPDRSAVRIRHDERTQN